MCWSHCVLSSAFRSCLILIKSFWPRDDGGYQERTAEEVSREDSVGSSSDAFCYKALISFGDPSHLRVRRSLLPPF